MGEARRRKLAGNMPKPTNQEKQVPTKRIAISGAGRHRTSAMISMLLAIMAGNTHQPRLPVELLREMRR